MKKLLAMLLALLLLTAIGCGSHPDFKETAFVDYGGPFTETESLAETEAQAPETEAEVPTETEAETDASAPEEPDGLRVIYLDNDRDGVNEIKLVVDVEAAKKTDAVPFRIDDIDNPSEDSFRTVSMYDLRGDEPKLIWYTNLCMGSTPRGGVALKGGGIFSWYYDVYESGDGVRISLSCYDYGTVDTYGNVSYRPLMKKGSVVTNVMSAEDFETYGLRHTHTLQHAVDIIDEKLNGAEILLDVTGTAPIFSTDDNRFTKSYWFGFDYRQLEKCLAPENQDQYIVPLS